MPDGGDVYAGSAWEDDEALATLLEHARASGRTFRDDVLQQLTGARAASAFDTLLTMARTTAEHTTEVTRILGAAARQLAADDTPPSGGIRRAAWDLLCATASRLHGSGVQGIERPPFLDHDLLDALRQEARALLEMGNSPHGRTTRPAGDVLAHLAVSRQLRELASEAAGVSLEPTFNALYEFDPPDHHVRTHLDGEGYDVIFHLLLEHAGRDGADRPSVLVAHLPGRTVETTVTPGEGVLLHGRGTPHSWRCLGPDEHRTLVAVGFRPGPSHGRVTL